MNETNQPDVLHLEDWKDIALALAERVSFAIANCQCKGGILNTDTFEVTSWRDYMVDGLVMIPAWSVNREIMDTFSLPPSRQKKSREVFLKKRAPERKVSNEMATY